MTYPLPAAEDELRLTRRFAAPRERVFHAWTDPRYIQQWMGGSAFASLIAEVDLRVGGSYRIHMKPVEGDEFFIVGTYREILSPEKLVYTWAMEHAGQLSPFTLVTVEFMAVNDATDVMIHHTGFTDPETRELHHEGWLGCLDRIDPLLASNS